MAPLAERLATARRIAQHPRIKVTDIESRLGTRYTADTLAALRQRMPRLRFVWIMGADNLQQISRWHGWTRIFGRVPVAVFDRPNYCYQALASRAAQRYRRYRLPDRQAGLLAGKPPPVWCFIPAARHPASATDIRARLADRHAPAAF